MKKFDILRELPKCDTETRSEQVLLPNGADRLARCRVATKLQFVKKTIMSAKPNTRIFPVSGFALSNVADICIIMILYELCLLPA
jgi:hypothetical protein